MEKPEMTTRPEFGTWGVVLFPGMEAIKDQLISEGWIYRHPNPWSVYVDDTGSMVISNDLARPGLLTASEALALWPELAR